MHRPIGPRTRAAPGVLLVAILTATSAPASSVALAVDASPEPGASPVTASPITETIHGWPDARRNPAGLYSWPVRPGTRTWMHNLGTSISDSVELMFYAADRADGPGSLVSPTVSRSWLQIGDPSYEHPARVLDVHTEVWLLDVNGTRVTILLDSFPDTDPALLAEAQAVIESIVVEPTESGYRLVFRLLRGWDSG